MDSPNRDCTRRMEYQLLREAQFAFTCFWSSKCALTARKLVSVWLWSLWSVTGYFALLWIGHTILGECLGLVHWICRAKRQSHQTKGNQKSHEHVSVDPASGAFCPNDLIWWTEFSCRNLQIYNSCPFSPGPHSSKCKLQASITNST